ncbi:LamG-like jellyroll fold domain-containing protein [uncultured Lutibacter sp.]|uniref:LamG-like jellyroll fold domain-containing protein n=1 Tax=uncultured Lutibacter sp. TaxID=437739 RepID=UPI002607E88F|nr:LamG-like jellyroll fold domain-containing protein [uncultured Lutibacter sp.]
MKQKLLFLLLFGCSFLTVNTQNLVAYYPFNGNANDESGNANHGTVNGATLTTDRFGSTDSAYEFDGIDDFIQVTNSSSLDITGNELSINMWLYNDNPDTSNLWKGISKGGFDVENGYELIFTNDPGNSGGKLSLNVGGGGYNVSSFNTYSNQWIMLTGTFNNGVGKIYINGIEQTKTPQGTTNLISSTSDLFIGQRNPANNYDGFVKGKIDDIKIYNKALTQEEIKNEFKGLVAYYPFNGNANDESGNNHHGTVFGPTLTADRFGNPDSAYHYHGNANNDYIDIGDWENGGPMSFNLWVKWEKFNNWGVVMDLAVGRNNNNIYIGNLSTTNTFMFHTLDGSTKYLFYCNDLTNYPNSPLTLNSWTMITCTVDAVGLMKAYKNGELIGTFNGFTPTRLFRTAQYFGSYNYPENGYFLGDLDDVRIYQSVLTDAEILNLFTYNTLKVEKIENVASNNFYVNNNILYFKNVQNLNEINKVEVYNLFGQKVFKTLEIAEQIPLNILQKGIYILKVKNTNGNYYSFKFLIN